MADKWGELPAVVTWFVGLLEGDSQILANLPGELVTNLLVPWNRGALILSRIIPPRMTTAFSDKDAAMPAEALEQGSAFHMARGTSV